MLTISYACIFKNEAKNLPMWIKSAKRIANRPQDEIIAVDTGSTDNSAQILKDNGIEPLYFKWINDFSAAKNFALSHAKGDWVLFLDADEYFDPNSQKRVRDIIKKVHNDKKIKVIECIMKNIDTADNRVISTMTHWRIFRNLPDLKYIKKIHEALYYSGNEELQYYKSDLTIIHTGYSKDINRAKNERNLKLLEAELEEKKGDPDDALALYLAMAYMQTRDFAKAKKYAYIALEKRTPVIDRELVRLYMILLSLEEEENKPRIIDEGLEATRDYPELLYEKIKILLPMGKYEEVQKLLDLYFLKLKDKNFIYSYDNNISATEPYVYLLQAELYYFLKKFDLARDAIALAKKLFPGNEDIARKYEIIFR